MKIHTALLSLLVCVAITPAATAQTTGSIQGKVTLEGTGAPLHHAMVLLPKIGRSVSSNEDGGFEFLNLPPGTYEVVAHLHTMGDDRKTVEVKAGEAASVEFRLRLEAPKTELTVTASGRPETTLEAVPSVTTLGSLEMQGKAASISLGDLLEDQAGVAKRSFGPGNSRPVIRGFDGDRVLILKDGIRTGTISSQSGDHGEPVDAGSVERIEVVRGPATLLYGSNAIGGVVNIIDEHDLSSSDPHEGLRGHVGGSGGTNNALGGGNGSFEFGRKGWLLFGGGGGMRTGDYHAPNFHIDNSSADQRYANVGFSKKTGAGSMGLSYGLTEANYGVPFAQVFHGHHHDDDHDDDDDDHHGEEGDPVRLSLRRHNVRFTGALTNLAGPFERFALRLNYSDYQHKELEGAEIGTQFFNKQFVYRGELEQRRRGRWSGSLGFWGLRRDYEARGEEALSPPVDQTAFAAFGLQQLNFERVRFQFGGRLETNRYSPNGPQGESGEDAPKRNFTGGSFSAGANFSLWKGGAFVSSYSHSYRAPALEELYNFGPHVGNVTFEIGNPLLTRERSDGVDLSLRHQSGRLRFEYNFFYYRMDNLVYLAPTGKFEDGLPEANYLQADGKYYGNEVKFQAELHRKFWLMTSLDQVRADVTSARTPMPRIPPVRGRAGVEFRHRGLTVRPELAMVSRQDRTAPNELPTAGYAVPGVNAFYSVARQHTLHTFGVNAFNVSNRLYRNHLSFIKELAPEMGRGVRFSYSLHWF
jgi:iron complex outermembrane receptor protein